MRGRDLAIALSIFLGAVLVRLVGMALAFNEETGFEKFFLAAGRLIEDGWRPDEPFAYSPAYVYFLAVLLRLGASVTDITLVQIVLGALTCVLISNLTRRLFGRRESIVAGLLAAVYGPFLLYSIAFESDVLGLFTYCAMAVAVVAATERPAVWRVIPAGLLLGMRAVQRPDALLFLVLILIVWWFAFRSRWAPGRRTVVLASFCVAVLIPIAPITWQNYRAGGEVVPVMSSGGWVFYTSHNYAATGLSYYPPPLALAMMHAPLEEGQDPLARLDDAVSRRLAGIDEGRVFSPSESSRFWFGEGLDSIRRRGLEQIALQARKIRYMFHGYEGHDNISLLVAEDDLGPLTLLGMGLLAPFGLVGFVLACRSGEFRRQRMWTAAALIATPVLSMSIFYVGPRFRLELGAMLMPFAASGLVALSRLLKGRRFRAALATGGAILLLTFALNLRESGLRQQARSRAIQLLVFRGDRADTEDEARLVYESAIRTAAYPGEAEAAYLALARIAAARGEIAEATRYEAIAAGWLPDDLLLDLTARPDDPDALFALGRHRLLTRDPGGAAEAFAGAAHLAPGDPDILYASAVAAFGSGSATPDQVAGMIGKAMSIGLRFSPNAVPASVLEARCHIAMGKLDEAEAALDRALRRSPDDGPALALRARIRSNG